jgi:histidine triad (HIT) family protein
MSDECVFCRILAGELPASFVLRGERVAAFMDIQPVNPGHVLVIPLRHAASLAELDAEEAAEMMRAGRRVAAALRESGLRCEGVNLFLADGEAAGQEVFPRAPARLPPLERRRIRLPLRTRLPHASPARRAG